MFDRPRLGQIQPQMANEVALYTWDWEDALRDLGIDTVLQDFRIDTINTLDIAFECGQHQVHRGCIACPAEGCMHTILPSF